jgi:prostaglandin-endoperoxide synthase 2
VTARDRSRDGLRNRIEDRLLSNLRPFWAFVNRTPWLARIINRVVVGNAVDKLPARPLRLSTMADYTTWDSLNDRTWFGRYRPPATAAALAALPSLEKVAKLFEVRPEGPRLSTRSTLLFPAFAQWFTDGFLMTNEDSRLRTRTNHQIDLCQLYGMTPDVTQAIRLRDGTSGRRGRLRSVENATGEWAPPLFDADGRRVPDFAALPEPLKLPSDHPPGKKLTIFAFGGERANANLFTAAINTLFLREHNRLCAMLERNNPGWDDDRVFHTARAINTVQLIRVVVQEYINHVSPYWLQFLADPAAAHRAAWNRTNWIPVEFNLLYRWHSLIPEAVRWQGEALPIAACQFDHGRLLTAGLEAALVSASATQAWALGLFNTAAMLRRVEMQGVEQGRANRLASYNDYRENAHYPRVTRFEQISGDPAVVAALRDLYGDVDRVEFFVGLFAEDLKARSAVPPLIGRMVAADAFSHALTNPLLSPLVFNAQTFTQAGLDVISETGSLADLALRNTKGWGDGRVSMEWLGYRSSA